MTRAVVLALAFLLLVATSACGMVVADPVQYSWARDPACPAFTERQAESIAVAVELWAEWGVTLSEETGAAMPDILVCFTPDEPREGFAGWESSRRDGRYRIDIDARESDVHDRNSVAVHEFGHVVLFGNEHLPNGELGIMASGVGEQPDGPAVEWSPDDVAHLERHGFARF
jgi:hypothetical protein